MAVIISGRTKPELSTFFARIPPGPAARPSIMDGGDQPMKEVLHGQLSSMQEFFDRSTRALEEADSGFAPQSGLFTVSQMVAHVAQTVDWFMAGAFAPGGFSMDFEGMDKEVRGVT